MILSDRGIREAMSSGEIGISPFDKKSIQPASLDIRLGTSFGLPKPNTSLFTPKIVKFHEQLEYDEFVSDSFILYTGMFVLGTTMEKIKLADNITAFVEGRSSIGRLGLFVQNAGWVDPGFEGEITLELYNAGPYPIELRAGTRVAQLVFAMMDYPADNPYRGKYQGQTGATGSSIYKDYVK